MLTGIVDHCDGFKGSLKSHCRDQELDFSTVRSFILEELLGGEGNEIGVRGVCVCYRQYRILGTGTYRDPKALPRSESPMAIGGWGSHK